MSDPGAVPASDLADQHREIAEEVQFEWARAIERTEFIGGGALANFERAFADFVGSRNCIGVANGTDAIELTLRALNIGPGHECIVPANSFIATAESVARTGAVPVFVDCLPENYLIDPEAASNAISPRTRAIIPVHLYGQMAAVEEVLAITRGRDINVVEDAAQAHGATRHGLAPAALSQAAATSFYPGKNLGAYGDAGGVTTNSDEIAQRVRRLANHGGLRRYEHEIVGFNSRLDSLQAIVLTAKLKRLDSWNSARRKAAEHYSTLLEPYSHIVRPTVESGNSHVWHQYVVRVPDRDRVLKSLNERGVGAAVHYPLPVHLTPAFVDCGTAHACPVAERLAQEILSLPIFPSIRPSQQERVVELLLEALS